MKISVSLSDRDVEFLDRYAKDTGDTRSGALQRAIRALKYESLGDQYEAAIDEGSPWDMPLDEMLAAARRAAR